MSDNNTSTEPLVIRPSVVGMAAAMERKLRKHDATRGITGWRGFDREQLLEQLRTEVDELDAVVTNAAPKPQTGETTPFRNQLLQDRITGEAADVANMAMMVADVDGDLEQEGALWALVRIPGAEDTAKDPVEPAEAPVGDPTAAQATAINAQIEQIHKAAVIGTANPSQAEIVLMASLAMDRLDTLHGDNVLSAAIEAQICAGSDLVLAVRIALESMRAADQAEDGAAAAGNLGVSEFDWSAERRLLFEKAKQVLETAEMRHCRICLCTDEYGCFTGEHTSPETNPCSWAEDDLCSRCAHCVDDGQRTPTPETPAPEPVTICMPGESADLGLGRITAAGDRPILIGLTGPGHITVWAQEPEDSWPGTRQQYERYEFIRMTGHTTAAVEYLLSIWKGN